MEEKLQNEQRNLCNDYKTYLPTQNPCIPAPSNK